MDLPAEMDDFMDRFVPGFSQRRAAALAAARQAAERIAAEQAASSGAEDLGELQAEVSAWTQPAGTWLLEVDISHFDASRVKGGDAGRDTCLEIQVKVEKQFVDCLTTRGLDHRIDELAAALEKHARERYPPTSGDAGDRHPTRVFTHGGNACYTLASVLIPTCALIQPGSPACDLALDFYKWRDQYCKRADGTGKPRLPPGPHTAQVRRFFSEDWEHIAKPAIHEWVDSHALKMPTEQRAARRTRSAEQRPRHVEQIPSLWLFTGSRITHCPQWPEATGQAEPQSPALRSWVAVSRPEIDWLDVMQPVIAFLGTTCCQDRGVDLILSLSCTCSAVRNEFAAVRGVIDLLQVIVTVDRGTLAERQLAFTRQMTRKAPLIEAFAHEDLQDYPQAATVLYTERLGSEFIDYVDAQHLHMSVPDGYKDRPYRWYKDGVQQEAKVPESSVIAIIPNYGFRFRPADEERDGEEDVPGDVEDITNRLHFQLAMIQEGAITRFTPPEGDVSWDRGFCEHDEDNDELADCSDAALEQLSEISSRIGNHPPWNVPYYHTTISIDGGDGLRIGIPVKLEQLNEDHLQDVPAGIRYNEHHFLDCEMHKDIKVDWKPTWMERRDAEPFQDMEGVLLVDRHGFALVSMPERRRLLDVPEHLDVPRPMFYHRVLKRASLSFRLDRIWCEAARGSDSSAE